MCLRQESRKDKLELQVNKDDFEYFIANLSNGVYQASKDNLVIAKRIAFIGWAARAKERGLEPPSDLSNGCKFSSLFVKLLFGGEIKGSYLHQFNMIGDELIDFSEESLDVREIKEGGDDPYEVDDDFLFNDEHIESMYSCLPRVQSWINRFNHSIQIEQSDNSSFGFR